MDELLFYRGFVDDVRRCAGGSAPAAVAEIEARIRAALDASPLERDRRLAQVVAAVNGLLAGVPSSVLGAAARLRVFVRQNAHLESPRDVAITDFRFEMRMEGVLNARSGRRFIVHRRVPRAPNPAPDVLADEVPPATRRFAEWAVYTLCGGAALAALWFAFIFPSAQMRPLSNPSRAALFVPPPQPAPFDGASLNALRDTRLLSLHPMP